MNGQPGRIYFVFDKKIQKKQKSKRNKSCENYFLSSPKNKQKNNFSCWFIPVRPMNVRKGMTYASVHLAIVSNMFCSLFTVFIVRQKYFTESTFIHWKCGPSSSGHCSMMERSNFMSRTARIRHFSTCCRHVSNV